MAAEKNQEDQAYTQAVKSGLYAKKSGLTGKYDNVRRYWEDEVTRECLRPFMLQLLERAKEKCRRIRILDLGCGSADGFELLTGVRERDPGLYSIEVDLLTPQHLGLYKGVELNQELLEQAREIYDDNPKMVFQQGDFCDGLPLPKDEPPYDLYFMSYGTSSHHNDDETMVKMLADIADRTEDYAIVVCDWLGRYSYEWQNLWVQNPEELKNMDYAISYIYDKEEREKRRDELQHLTLRLMSRPEIDDILKKVNEKSGATIKPLSVFDRSTLTGRHIDTGDYNPGAQPIRESINSLHEPNLRTNLHHLRFDYVPKQEFDFLNDYFEQVQVCWNIVVDYTCKLLANYDIDAERLKIEDQPVPASYPEPLRVAMHKVRHLIEGVGWLQRGLPRENVIEPQLGYVLRDLVMGLQKGQGCSHGLVGIFEINKSSNR
ncbi:MAG: class I SAM-dependent methyltransferase [Lentisphaeria bacterium]